MATSKWDALRKTLSSLLTLSALGLIFYCIAKGYAALPGPPLLHYLLFLFVLVLLGYLEGLQIAILELERSKLPESKEFKKAFPRAKYTLDLATGRKGLNVQRFLIGRQFFVVFVVFLCAQLTTYPDLPSDGWPKWLFVVVIDTGLPGALVVLAFGQLMPQLVAATHPVHFINLPGSWYVIMLTLGLETIGIAHFSWVLSSLTKCLSRIGEHEDVEKFEARPAPSGSVQPEDEELDRLLSDDLYVSAEAAAGASQLGVQVLTPKSASAITDSSEERFAQMPPWLLPKTKKAFKNWGFNPTSGEPFPSPDQIVEQLLSSGENVPRYLLPPSHKMHIPPHVVAYDLIQRESELIAHISALEQNFESAKLKLRSLGEGKQGWLEEEIQVQMSPSLKPMSTVYSLSGLARRRQKQSDSSLDEMPVLKMSRAALEKVESYRTNYRNWRHGSPSGASGEL